MNPPNQRRADWHRVGLYLILGLLGIAGCGRTEVETTYGRSRGQSINGTNALAELIRGRGHPVRAAVRYTEALSDWAQVIVRFAPYPGPPSRAEGDWLIAWLRSGSGRKLVYVVRDYDAGPDFWAEMLAALPAQGQDDERARIKTRRAESLTWRADLPKPSKNPADRDNWFGTRPADSAHPSPMTNYKDLGGPWATGINAAAAALPKHEAIQAENNEEVLFTGDGAKLAVTWSFRAEDEDPEEARSGVLVLADGAFTLNASLLNRARRPLATRVVDWVGPGAANVAFVEGGSVLDDEAEAEISPFHLLTVTPFNWVAAHLLVFGGLMALALATTLGRSRPDSTRDFERTSAHPVALGSLLGRTHPVDMAREILAQYRRWRHPGGGSERPDPALPPPRRAPHA